MKRSAGAFGLIHFGCFRAVARPPAVRAAETKSTGSSFEFRDWWRVRSKLCCPGALIVHPPSHEFGPAGKIGANGRPVGIAVSAKEPVDEVC